MHPGFYNDLSQMRDSEKTHLLELKVRMVRFPNKHRYSTTLAACSFKHFNLQQEKKVIKYTDDKYWVQKYVVSL